MRRVYYFVYEIQDLVIEQLYRRLQLITHTVIGEFGIFKNAGTSVRNDFSALSPRYVACRKCCQLIHRESKNLDTGFLSITSLNANRFTKLLH